MQRNLFSNVVNEEHSNNADLYLVSLKKQEMMSILLKMSAVLNTKLNRSVSSVDSFQLLYGSKEAITSQEEGHNSALIDDINDNVEERYRALEVKKFITSAKLVTLCLCTVINLLSCQE